MDYASYPDQATSPADRGDYTLEEQRHDLEDFIEAMTWEDVYTMLSKSEETEVILNNLVLLYFAKRYDQKASINTAVTTIVNKFEAGIETYMKGVRK